VETDVAIVDTPKIERVPVTPRGGGGAAIPELHPRLGAPARAVALPLIVGALLGVVFGASSRHLVLKVG